jgi:uncharacterized protein YkwD
VDQPEQLCKDRLMTVGITLRHALTLPTLAVLMTLSVANAQADGGGAANDTVIPNNQRLNHGVAESVYGIKKQAGCTTDLRMNPALDLAAQRHAEDMLGNPNLDGDIGSDGSTAQDRARAAGYRGTVTETVATLPSLAINGIDILGNWYYRPDYFAIMSNCANTQIGVRSVNSPGRSVAVAVYGQPG